MRKSLVVLTMAMFIGSMGATVFAMNTSTNTECTVKEDDKKKKKKGEAKACCADKDKSACADKEKAAATETKSCSGEAKAEGAKCCASKAAAEKK